MKAKTPPRSFAARLIAWQKKQGRHGLPWQGTRDPYAVWVSEIMLQQTQVATVIPYYRRFMTRFRDVHALATAPVDDVLAHWSGLGYYSRARNLHRAAQAIVTDHGGRFPRDFEAVLALPGIGRSTAAAVCAFAFRQRHAILDGNVKRVLARHFGIRGYPGDQRVAEALWRKAARLLPAQGIAVYTQGLMDLGAAVCTRGQPRCAACPVSASCVARRRGLIAEVPARKPKKATPQRETMMLVLRRAGEILLEKRPPTGIWGGLWSFPEAAAGENIEALCARRFGARVRALAPLSVLDHGFTHFRLSIVPQPLRVTGLTPHAAEPGCIWLTVEEARRAAVPAPVKRILALL